MNERYLHSLTSTPGAGGAIPAWQMTIPVRRAHFVDGHRTIAVRADLFRPMSARTGLRVLCQALASRDAGQRIGEVLAVNRPKTHDFLAGRNARFATGGRQS